MFGSPVVTHPVCDLDLHQRIRDARRDAVARSVRGTAGGIVLDREQVQPGGRRRGGLPSARRGRRPSRSGSSDSSVHCRREVARNLLGRSLLLDQPVAEEHHAVRVAERFGVVRGGQHRAVTPDHVPERLEDQVGVLRIDLGDRLVRHHDLRLGDQRAGHRHALLLAGRQLVGPVVDARLQAEALQPSLRPLSRLDEVDAVDAQGELDVLDGRERGQQSEALEDDADPLSPEARRSSADSEPIGWPFQRTSPSSGASSPASTPRNVVFPNRSVPSTRRSPSIGP